MKVLPFPSQKNKERIKVMIKIMAFFMQCEKEKYGERSKLPLVRLNATKRVDSKFVRLNATNDEIKLQ